MKRADNKEEHAHYRFVAANGISKGELDFGLNLEAANQSLESEFKKEVVKGKNRENEEEEDDVMTIEKVVGLGGGVIEPECLRQRQRSP